MGIRTTFSLVAAAAALIGASAQAGIIVPDLSMQVLRDVGDNQFEAWSDSGAMTDEGGGLFSFNGGAADGQPDYEDPFGWFIDYGVTYASGQTSNGGPVTATLDFGLTNNTGMDDTFTVIASVPLIQMLANTSVSGSVEGGLQDADVDGSATLTSDGANSIYSGLVDGNSALDLLLGGFIFDTPGGTFGPDSGSAAGPAIAMTDIGIVITFDLSAGDSANFTADFTITGDKIPAPGALALFGLAGLAGTRRRRH